MKKTFLIINLSFLGDVLLTNSLCQNIKKNYPDSRIVFIVNKPFYEAAKYQACVDEVIAFDKNGEHKGFWGLLKFVFNNNSLRGADAAFIIYANDRGILISYLLGCKRRISGSVRCTKYLLTDLFLEDDQKLHMQDANANLLKTLTGKNVEICPIKYITNPESDFVQQFKKKFANQKIIGLCTISKQKEKDMPIDTAISLINKLNSDNNVVFYFGAGKRCRDYADELKKLGCVNFVDLTDTTTINQLANLLSICQALLSVDTGTMHLACAVGTPVVGVFYKKDMVQKWGPREFLYKSKIIDENYSADFILEKMYDLLKSEQKNSL